MKKILLSVLVFTALNGTLSGCILPVAVGAGAAAGGYYVGQDDRPFEVITQDAGITASIKAKLIREKDLSAFDIDVDTYEGEVNLYGKVSNQNTAERALKIAKSVEGVKKVTSHLEPLDALKSMGKPGDDTVEHPDVDMPEELPKKSNSGYGID